jgi:DNA-binding transcriptional ArsR family regulator
MKIDRSYSAARVRAAAHPLRLRLLELLREGPATASQLARRLGETSGSTSYHLRVLAKAGLIDEDAERGNGRDRWWRRQEEMVIVTSSPAAEPEYEAAIARLQEVFLERDERALERFYAHPPDAEATAAAFIGGWAVYATPAEIEELSRTIVSVVDRLRRAEADRPEGARLVYVTWRALPQPDEPG